jgi:hypothetical protein
MAWRSFSQGECSGFLSFVSSFWFVFFFFFCQVRLQQESILFGLLKVSQAHLELAASRLLGGQQRPEGQQAGGPLPSKPEGGWGWHEGGSLLVLSVYCGVEKISTG